MELTGANVYFDACEFTLPMSVEKNIYSLLKEDSSSNALIFQLLAEKFGTFFPHVCILYALLRVK